jgi:hypothetical protein
MHWNDDVPRRLWSEDGYIMVATMPKLTDKLSTVRLLSSPLKLLLMPKLAGRYHQVRPKLCMLQ